MYTAKIQRKDFINGAIRVFVEFTNGTDTIVENCIPQNEEGLKHWVRSRLETFNAAPVIDATYVDGSEIDVSNTVITEPVLTQAEIDENQWFADYQKWTKIKTTLIDTGILTGQETQLVNLLNKVKTNFKPAYLTKI